MLCHSDDRKPFYGATLDASIFVSYLDAYLIYFGGESHE